MMHVIGKQTIEINTSSKEGIYAIQQQLSDLYWSALVPAIGQLFDGLVGEEETLKLDKLEIDLGIIDLKNGRTNEIVDQVIRQLKNELETLIQSKSTKLINQPKHQQHFDVWLQWLEKGYLPGLGKLSSKKWQKDIFKTLGIDSQKVLNLQLFLHQKPVALERLIWQHSTDFLTTIVELYTGHSQKQLPHLLKEIKETWQDTSTLMTTIIYRKIDIYIWRVILNKTLIQRKKLTTEAIFKVLIAERNLSPFFTFLYKETLESGIKQRKKKVKTPLLISLLAQNKAFFEAKDRDHIIFKQSSDTTHPIDSVNMPPAEKESLITKKGEVTPKDEADSPSLVENEYLSILEQVDIPEQKDLTHPLFFRNAGVVLIHPFLSRFFKKLDLLEEQEFKDIFHQSKAILLIHFLATGRLQTEGFNLLLPKLLCGMPFNQPLDHSIVLKQEEQEEAEGLLAAVIQHWGALGTVSTDSLREGFLNREGKLLQKQTGWNLLVEQKTIDLLLDRLPWNISMIKTPWMKDILNVEWR